MPGKQRKTIQIDAVKTDSEVSFTKVTFFDSLVKPMINEKLISHIRNVTGLTQKKIDTKGLKF